MPDPSNNQGDSPAPTVANLTYRTVVFSRATDDLLWILATHKTLDRFYVYRSTDDGLTWTSRGIAV